MALIKKLTKHGNSYSLILDKALIDLLDIDPETPLEISTNDGKSLVVKPLKDEILDEVIQEKYRKFKEKYGNALKRLA